MLHISSLATLDAVEEGYTITLAHPILIAIIVLCSVTVLLVALLFIGILVGKKKQAKNSSKLGETIGAAVGPVMKELSSQNQILIQALVLAQSNDKDSKLALVNLLKSAMSKESVSVTEKISKSIEASDAAKKKEKEKAKQDVSVVLDEISKDKSLGGISI